MHAPPLAGPPSCAHRGLSAGARRPARALERSELLAVNLAGLELLLASHPAAGIRLLLAGARAFGPLIRSFICLGLNRVWLRAGESAYQEGDVATSVFITISGRLRLVRSSAARDGAGALAGEEAVGALSGVANASYDYGAPLGDEPRPRGPWVVSEDEIARGQAVGAVWVLTSGVYDNTAVCVRDSELVRMSRSALEVITSKSTRVAAQLLAGMARRLGERAARAHRPRAAPSAKDIATIALHPLAGCSMDDLQTWAGWLRDALAPYGPALLLCFDTLALSFRDGTAERLHRRFYRSKFTSWLAEMEETYRFIILVADAAPTSWTRICLSQADCTLLVADAAASPEVTQGEWQLHWEGDGPGGTVHGAGAAAGAGGVGSMVREVYRQKRLELVLLQRGPEGRPPRGTARWLEQRPRLARHHHVRWGSHDHMARLGRWLAGHAVGLVLSGGGSRGLAHLGVLRALDELGVPIDVVGGTSQGAFMAALYAQQLGMGRMAERVKYFARNLGSIPTMLTDLTLPLLSVFTGAGLDGVVRESLGKGAGRIEDLWVRFFCVTTSLTRGGATCHHTGPLARLVRASMGVVGLVPPVFHDGELLVDGGYTKNIPVDTIRAMGVETVIVVDVEDKDLSVFRDVRQFDGAVSGWRVLWDRLLPLAWRRYKLPRYSQIVGQLTFLSHVQQLRAVVRDHPIDLYLRPTGIGAFKLMDYHLMDRIVRDAYRYGWSAVSEWQCRVAAERALEGRRPVVAGAAAPAAGAPLGRAASLPLGKSVSAACMAQVALGRLQQEYGGTPRASEAQGGGIARVGSGGGAELEAGGGEMSPALAGQLLGAEQMWEHMVLPVSPEIQFEPEPPAPPPPGKAAASPGGGSEAGASPVGAGAGGGAAGEGGGARQRSRATSLPDMPGGVHRPPNSQ